MFCFPGGESIIESAHLEQTLQNYGLKKIISLKIGMCRIHNILLIIFASLSLVAEEDHVLTLSAERESKNIRLQAMPELGETRIEKILKNYYHTALGGPENWEKVVSLNMIGTMQTAAGDLQLNAYQRKPNLIKISLTQESGKGGLTLAYDGTIAWKQVGRRGKPEPMAEAEARRFIHSARFGNYLLYPFAAGKRIRLIDTVPMEGAICHQLRVELDAGYQVDYFIDIRSFLEIKVVNTDLRTGSTNSIFYQDYRRESGIPFARAVKSFEEDKWVSTLSLEEVKVNTGVMPWMFHLPE